MIKISVIIGTYNQKEPLKLVLESFSKQTINPSEFEVIVVDSFSNDGTDAMIESLGPHPFPLNYIRQENNGKTAARNRGIKEAKGEIILLTDSDMIADPNLVEEHLKAHQENQNASFEGTTYNFKHQTSNFKINPKSQIPNDQIEPYIKQRLRPGQRLKWSYFLSGNLSIKKETIIKAGMFDEDFKSYGWEDIELGYRLHKMKVPLFYLPSAKNYHYHFVTDTDMVKRKYNMGKSAAIFYKKHPNFEIKMYLGMNPVAMFVYNYIKKRPNLLKKITKRAKSSKFYQYLLEEYSYRLGLSGK
ncbi:MAG: glycosyltransferase [Candidatus Saganbacteria bacterium]|nr:glycosyltransferase [Candidatus Saganbacteria bacterium]